MTNRITNPFLIEQMTREYWVACHVLRKTPRDDWVRRSTHCRFLFDLVNNEPTEKLAQAARRVIERHELAGKPD